MAMIYTVDGLEGMCDLMCDNNINSRNVHEIRDYTVGELVERIITIRDMYKGDMTRSDSDTLADVCNILDRTFDNDVSVMDILYGEE